MWFNKIYIGELLMVFDAGFHTGLLMIFVDDLCRWSFKCPPSTKCGGHGICTKGANKYRVIDDLLSVHLLRSAVDTAFAPKVQINTELLMVFDDDVSNVFWQWLVYWTITLALRIPVNHVTKYLVTDCCLHIGK